MHSRQLPAFARRVPETKRSQRPTLERGIAPDTVVALVGERIVGMLLRPIEQLAGPEVRFPGHQCQLACTRVPLARFGILPGGFERSGDHRFGVIGWVDLRQRHRIETVGVAEAVVANDAITDRRLIPDQLVGEGPGLDRLRRADRKLEHRNRIGPDGWNQSGIGQDVRTQRIARFGVEMIGERDRFQRPFGRIGDVARFIADLDRHAPFETEEEEIDLAADLELDPGFIERRHEHH